MKLLIILLISFVFSFSVNAAPVTIYTFDSKENEKIFYKLSDEIRCLVCQNQNIAESNSELAQDLRRQIYDMLQQGKSEDEIVTFMVERYGDYVLFNPPFKPLTWMLWLGPLIIFIFAAGYAGITINSKKRPEVEEEELSTEEASRLNDLKAELQQSANSEKSKGDNK